jgi:DNA-binding LacI/PurR family transcriptional regulator
MGFDNIPVAKYMSPPLTTISQPTDEIGALCATILLDLIEEKQPGKLRNLLPHQLLIRESTRRLV